MTQYSNEVVLSILGDMKSSFTKAVNEATSKLKQLEQATDKANQQTKQQAEATDKATKAAKDYGRKTEENIQQTEKYQRLQKVFFEDQQNGIKNANTIWEKYSESVSAGGVGLDRAYKKSRQLVSGIYDLDNRLKSINSKWGENVKEITASNLAQAEQKKLIRTTANGFDILSPKAAKYLNISEEQATALMRQSKSMQAYNKIVTESYGKSERYRNAVQDLGRTVGKTDDRVATWSKSLKKADSAINRIESGMAASKKGIASWVKNINLAKVASKELTGDLGLANNQLKVHSKVGLNALNITEEMAAKQQLLSNRYSEYGQALQNMYKTNAKMVPAFQELTKKYGTSNQAIKDINKSLTNTSQTINRQLSGAWDKLNKKVDQGTISADKARQTYARLEKRTNANAKAVNDYEKQLGEMTKKQTVYNDILKQNANRNRKFAESLDRAGKRYGYNSRMLQDFSKYLVQADNAISKTAMGMQSLGKNGQKFYNTANRMNIATQMLHGRLQTTNGMLGNLDNKLKGTTKRASAFGRAIREVADSFRSMAKYAAGAMIFYQIFTLFRTGEKAIRDFDQALKDLQAVLDATQTEVDLLAEKIQQVASDTKFSTTEVADGMKLLGQAGLTTQEVLHTIDDVTALATGTMAEFKTTSDLVTTTIRAFGKEAYSSGEIVDVFANAINRSKLSVDKLRIAFNYVAPVAAKAGVSFKETSAAMMTLANSGVRASTIGTGLRQVIRRLINPNKQFKNAIEEAGYSLNDVNPMFNDFATVIDRLGEVVPTAIDAFEFFKVRGAPAVSALTQNGVEGFNELLGSIEETGAAARMMETQVEGLGIKWKQVADKFTVLATELGEAGLTGALKGLANAIRGVLDGLIFLTRTGIAPAIAKIGLLIGSVIILRKAFLALYNTKLVNFFGYYILSAQQAIATNGLLTASVAGLRTALSRLWVLLISNPFVVIASAALGFLYVVNKLSERTDKLLAKQEKLQMEYTDSANELDYYIDKLESADKGTKEYQNVVERLLQSFPELKKHVNELTGEWEGNVKVLKELKQQKVEKIFDTLINKYDLLQQKISELTKRDISLARSAGWDLNRNEDIEEAEKYTKEIEQIYKRLADYLISDFPRKLEEFSGSNGVEKVKEVLIEIGGLTEKQADKVAGGAQDIIKNMDIESWEEKISGVKKIWDTYLGTLKDSRDMTEDDYKQLFTIIKDYEKEIQNIMNQGADNMEELVRKTSKKYSNMLSNIFGKAPDLARDYGSKLVRTLQSLPQELKDKLKDKTTREQFDILSAILEDEDDISEKLNQYKLWLLEHFGITIDEFNKGIKDNAKKAQKLLDQFELSLKSKPFPEEDKETENIYDKQLQQIDNNLKKRLLKVKEGSKKELQIQKEGLEAKLEVAKKEFEEKGDLVTESKVLDLRAKLNENEVAQEKLKTEKILDQYERRAEAREIELEEIELLNERKAIKGEVTDEEVDLMNAEARINYIEEEISKKKDLISKLKEEGGNEEKIKEIKQERKELENSLTAAQNERFSAYFSKAQAEFEQEKKIAEQKYKTATAGLEGEKERYKIVRNTSDGSIEAIEKEKTSTFNNLSTKLRATKNYIKNVRKIYSGRYKELENEQRDNSDKIAELKREETEIIKNLSQDQLEYEKELNEERIRQQGTWLEKTKLGLQNYTKTLKEETDDWVDITESIATTFQNSFSNALNSFVLNTKSASDAFRSFADSMLQNITKVMTNHLTQKMMSGLLGTGGGSGTGGFLTSAVGMVGGLFSGGGSTGIAPTAYGHTGGSVGVTNFPTKEVSGMVTAIQNSIVPRFHNGLNPDEFPTILQKGEEVIPKEKVGEEDKNVSVTNNIYIQAPDGKIAKESMNQMQRKIGKSINNAMRN